MKARNKPRVTVRKDSPRVNPYSTLVEIGAGVNGAGCLAEVRYDPTSDQIVIDVYRGERVFVRLYAGHEEMSDSGAKTITVSGSAYKRGDIVNVDTWQFNRGFKEDVMKRFTVRDQNGAIVAGLENVEEGNALLTGKVAYDKSIGDLNVDETAHGAYNKERYAITRTA